jgi:hypothetical protein
VGCCWVCCERITGAVNRINKAEKNGKKHLSELFFMNSSARVRTIFLPERIEALGRVEADRSVRQVAGFFL